MQESESLSQADLEELVLAIALRAARDGASIAIAAKTSESNPKLPGTIHTAAAEIEAAGGKHLLFNAICGMNCRLKPLVNQAAEAFGGIDILINNASAINLTRTDQTPAKRFDFMFDVNVRGTFSNLSGCAAAST